MASLASINIRFAVDLKEFSTEMQNSLRTIDKVGQKFQSVGRNMSAFVTLPILAAGAAAVKFASDYNESLNKVDVSFKSSSVGVKNFAKSSLESFGIAESTALDMAAAYGDIGTSMGLTTGEAAKMSTSLVGLAGDLASFKNISIDIANTAISAIFTGETESLKKLGIVLTEANLKHFALSSGIKKNYEQMSQAEKVQLRYNYILSVTKNSQGDFIRTQGGAANQTRIFQESLKQVGQQLGQVILPLFTKLITAVNQKIKGFLALSDATKTMIVVIGGLVSVIGPLLLGIGVLMSAVPLIVSGFAAVSGAITAVVSGFVLLSGAILPIVATVAFLYGAFLILGGNAKKASEATAELSDNTKELNAAVAVGNKNALNEITYLDKIYASATNVKLGIKERKGAVEELQALYPAYFKNLDSETIKNGLAETSYVQLRNAIFNKSRAVAIDAKIQENANNRLLQEIDLQNKVIDARKKYLELVKNPPKAESNVVSNGGVDIVTYKSSQDIVKEAAQDLQNFKTQLEEFKKNSLKADEFLLNAKKGYDTESAKLSENEIQRLKDEEAAAAAAAKGKEESLKKGTIAFYDKEIEGLKKLQKEIPVTNSAWKTYESRIDAIQVKIDALQNKGIKLPKPELPTEVDFEPQTLSIDYYEEQIARQKELQNQLATDTEEGRSRYQALAEQISNTEIIIQDMKGVDNLVESTSVVSSTLLDLSAMINESLTSLKEAAVVGIGEAIGGLISGTASLGSILGGMLSMVASFMKDLGKQMIQVGLASVALKNVWVSGPLAIAAGIALVALASVAQNTMQKGPKLQAFTTGGIVSGSSLYGDKILARVNSGEMIANADQQKKIWGAMNGGGGAMTIIPDVKLLGNDIYISFKRTEKLKERKG
jgi:hypothetical protein